MYGNSITLITLGVLGCLVSLGVSDEVNPQIIGKVGSKTFSISPEGYQGSGDGGKAWTDALTYCQRAGKVIASIESKAELNFVANFLKGEATSDREYNVWTAGTDYFTEGKWYWITTRRPVDFSVSQSKTEVSQNPWYNCLYLGPGGSLLSNYCSIQYARALCQ